MSPDTNVLIDLHRNLDAVEVAAFLGNPHLSGDWPTPVEALRDLLALWWWRDIRFVVGDWHLRDFRRPRRAPQLSNAPSTCGRPTWCWAAA